MGTFVGMVVLWGASATLGLDSTAVAFLGLGVLLLSGTLTLDDIAKQGDVLAIYLWFAVLFTLSSQLNELGFMGFLGQRLATALGGMSPVATGLILVVAYVLLHYLFVSQTAHLLALFGVFLDVGVRLGVPATILAFLLLFATNFFSGITPQGIEREPSLRGKWLHDAGRAVPDRCLSTAFSLLVYLVVGVPWLMLVAGRGSSLSNLKRRRMSC